MIKLKTIVTDLDASLYQIIEDSLKKNKADNFLYLLQAYRSSAASDAEIIKALSIKSNAFYVLKSRLHDKIQEHLAGDIHTSKEEVTNQLHLISEMCLRSSREVTTSFLQKLEQDLLLHDMHNELIVVYSSLKKLHTYSDKYYHYSQLYNKHIAFSLSLEKSLEILGNFNRSLGQYNFSRSPKHLETLNFLKNTISEHHKLNPSRQIELIQNIIELQLFIFTESNIELKVSVEEKLLQTQKIIDELPHSSPFKNFDIVVDHFYFEYYCKSGQKSLSQLYFEKVNSGFSTLLLSTHISTSAMFLISKLSYLQESERIELTDTEHQHPILFDPADIHSIVLLGIYQATLAHLKGKNKEATARLNELLNAHSFKEYFHINTEIRLTLAFFYIQLEETDLADHLLKNIYRKIKSEQFHHYACVLDLIKVFGEDIKHKGRKVTPKQKNHYVLFKARNTGEFKLLNHLVPALNKKYN